MFSGDIIGKYRLVRRLGRGGMGEVWLATASGYGGFKKNVVLKTLLPEHACDPLFIELLAQEARTCAKLSHPNLIEVFDFTEHGGIHLLAMEHVMGRPLNHIMRAAQARNWSVPAWFALRIAWECCRGLECAHDEGVIHCDLSPSNVLVTFTGITKILDFGVAHSIAQGPKADRLKGKFAYTAPERIKSLTTDRRTDIYSLGVMLYLVFTGQLPFTAATDNELLYKIVNTRPRMPSDLVPIDARIERLIMRAMERDPAHRYQTIREMVADLSPCLEGQLGTYGQHDVAKYLTELFEAPAVELCGRALPAIPTPPVGASEVITSLPGAWSSDDEVYDAEEIDIDASSSSILEIPCETAAALPASTQSAARFPRGSAPIEPVAKPNDTPTSKPLESLTKLFAPLPDAQEAHTSVQSLFESRPSSLAFGPSRIFDRPQPGSTAQPAQALLLDATEEAAQRADEPSAAEASDPAQPAEPELAARPGGFGSYSSSRPRRQSAWPWSSSRTKPD